MSLYQVLLIHVILVSLVICRTTNSGEIWVSDFLPPLGTLFFLLVLPYPVLIREFLTFILSCSVMFSCCLLRGLLLPEGDRVGVALGK